MKLLFLGTGTSHGVPSIDCMMRDFERCPAGTCRKAHDDPTSRYRRRRASALITHGEHRILIDTSQDFYEQMQTFRVTRIDALLYTHCHADHIYGLPDFRSYTRHQATPCYGHPEALAQIQQSFSYMFHHRPANEAGGIPDLTMVPITEAFEVFGLTIQPIPVVHGHLPCYGYRIGDLAYIPDAKTIPPESMEALEGIEVLILDCLRHRPHSTHMNVDEALAVAEELQPRQCWLTHMAHDLDCQIEEPKLPEYVRFAWDGLMLDAG